MGAVSWSIGPDAHRSLRLCWYAGLSVWLGFVGFVLAIGTTVSVLGLLAGDPGPALLLAVFALVGGPLSLLYVWPMLTDADQRPEFLTPPTWARARWIALGTVLVAAIVFFAPLGAVGVVALGLASPLVASVLRSEGELDPEAGDVTVNGRTADLGTVAGVRALHLGPLAICWLRYERTNSTPMAVRLLTVPGDVVPQLVEAIAVTDAPDRSTEQSRRSSRLAQIVMLVLGLGSLAVGIALFAIGPVPRDVALVGGGLFGVFGVLFTWLAYLER
jgi:hypothetical protein